MKSHHKRQILIDSLGQDQAQSNIAFSRLLLLRWGAIFCQAMLVATVILFFKLKPPLLILIAILIFGVSSNLGFYFFYLKRSKNIPEWLFAQVMFLDIILLTALLHFTGGPMNPFTFLFLIHVCLGAIIMRSQWAWALAAYTTFCYAILFFLPKPFASVEVLSTSGELVSFCQSKAGDGQIFNDNINLHLQGMLLAFSITVFFVVFFVSKIQKDLEEHQKRIVDLETDKNKSDKLASLATLAAGAAHEFSTPLSTIAVASSEMLSIMKQQELDPELISDTMLIREQVNTCREILYHMSADAGEHLAESLLDFSINELCIDVLDWFAEDIRQRIRIDCTIKDMSVRMPYRTLERIIRGMIKNGIDASEPNTPVFVSCRKDKKYLYFKIRDLGHGMDERTLSHAIEPFYTTKEPGKGLGLGLFLAESAAERFGGELRVSSEPGNGTTVVISFSLKQIQCS